MQKNIETYVEEIKNYVLKSPFFKTHQSLTQDKLKWYCQRWYPLQPEFTIGLLILIGKISERILPFLRERDFESAMIWRDILLYQAPPAIDEMGIGRAKSSMHDLLFLEQIESSGISRDEIVPLFKFELPLANLLEEMKHSFRDTDIIRALCMMFVAETIAKDLFIVQRNIFLAAGIQSTKLTHSNLHIGLESLHADESAQYMKILDKLGEQKSVEKYIRYHTALWREYLDFIWENINTEKMI